VALTDTEVRRTKAKERAYRISDMAADNLPCLGARPIEEIEAPELVAMTKAIEQR
jgi:hypothetical protein